MYRVSDVHFGARIYPKIYKSGARRTMSKSAVPYLYGAEETIPIEQLHPFANHPFHVRHDLEMKELMDSIEESGISIRYWCDRKREVSRDNTQHSHRAFPCSRFDDKALSVLQAVFTEFSSLLKWGRGEGIQLKAWK